MRNFILLTVILLSFTSLSAQVAESYKGCCETELVSFKSEKGVEIFIPHFFTPNDDGVNDRFLPLFNPEEVILEKCMILNESKDTILFDFGFGKYLKSELPERSGWNGKRYRHDEKDHIGAFYYSINFTIIGEGDINLKGTACVVRCDTKEDVLAGLKECLLDNDSIGELTSELDYLVEDECFEGN